MSLVLCIGYVSSQQANGNLSGAQHMHFEGILHWRTSRIKNLKTVDILHKSTKVVYTFEHENWPQKGAKNAKNF